MGSSKFLVFLLLFAVTPALAVPPATLPSAQPLSLDCDTFVRDFTWAQVREKLEKGGFTILSENEKFTVASREASDILSETNDTERACKHFTSRLNLSFKKYCVGHLEHFRTFFAQRVYRPILLKGQKTLKHAGVMFRYYFTGRDPDDFHTRWEATTALHKNGKYVGSFGHKVPMGMPEVNSDIVPNIHAEKDIEKQRITIGHDLVDNKGHVMPIKKFQIGPMIGVSGMSFPQLSMQSHLSLLYMHLKVNKEIGPMTLNTGEGGPGFHLALLKGDAQKFKEEVVKYGIKNGFFLDGSWKHAQVEVFVEDMMRVREELFKEFSQEDLDNAQLVIQMGPALYGLRGHDGGLDLKKLEKVAQNPAVKMFQFKLKQAAKRGGKLDAKKIDPVTAFSRELGEQLKEGTLQSPTVNPETQNWKAIARAIITTKAVTGKPVSLKFGVGDLHDTYDFFNYLKDAGALPDHIQVEGRGVNFSPGSGNAPFGHNTSHPINEAVMATNAILRKLEIRDQIVMEATGDQLLPAETMEKLALGANCSSAARFWMGAGLGCSMVKQCANGSCPYGIAANSLDISAKGLDPLLVGPQAFKAAAGWYKDLVTAVNESSITNWTDVFSQGGIGHPRAQIRKTDGKGSISLSGYYDPERMKDLFGDLFTEEEIRRYVYSSADPQEAETPPVALDQELDPKAEN